MNNIETEFGEIDILNEDEEDDVLVTYDIATYPSDLSLEVLVKQFKDGDIQIPDFQRDFVWTMKQSSLLIESFILGLPVPPVFFYIDSENRNIVVDGQQRIRTIVDYFDGYFGNEDAKGRRRKFRLDGIDERANYAKKLFEDLDDRVQRKLRGSVLRAINIRQISPNDSGTSMYHIFERLNTGGTALKPQEIRNCVFHGNLVTVLHELNLNEYWRRILGNKKIDKHRKDVELILRVMSMIFGWRRYEKPMKEFLNKTMKRYKEFDSAEVEEFADRFPKLCEEIVEVLGDKPFSRKGPVNAAILDSVMTALYPTHGELPNDLHERIERLLRDRDYDEMVTRSTADTSFVRGRIEKAVEYLN